MRAKSIAAAIAVFVAGAAAGDFVVSDDFENGVGKWKLASSRFAIKPGMGVKNSSALVWTGTEPDEKWEFTTIAFKAKVGHEYSFTLKAQSTEDIVGRVYVRLVSLMPGGKKTFFRLDGRPIINNGWKAEHKKWWTDMTGCCPPVPS